MANGFDADGGESSFLDEREREQYERELKSYPYQPLGVFRNGGIWPVALYRFSLAACARWEARYIVEWILYHRSIGIDHIYLYCNDDEPAELFEKVLPFTQGNDPFVTFRHYSFQGLQFQMYFHFIRNYSHETEWMMFLDIDEFICIRGSNDIASLMGSMPVDADAVYFNWCSFGHNGHKTRPDGHVLLNYTRREGMATPFTKVFIKSNRVPYAEFFRKKTAPVMHDYTILDPNIAAYNVICDSLKSYYEDFPNLAWDFLQEEDRSQRILNTAFIAHYNIKSDADFQIRVERGLRGDYGSEKMWGDMSPHDRHLHHLMTNAVEDFYLRDYWLGYLSCGWKLAVFQQSQWPLVSFGKTAIQSSTVHSRNVEDDAAMILNGRPIGASQNHTGLDDSPWWQIDLGSPHRIHELRLFNRLDEVLDRMKYFEIAASERDGAWVTIFARNHGAIFGGIDGSPFIWVSDEGFVARWIRVSIPGNKCFLHLDQIEFYGRAMPAAGQAAHTTLADDAQ